MGTPPPIYIAATTVTPSVGTGSSGLQAPGVGTFYGGSGGTLLYGGGPTFLAAGADGHPLGGAYAGAPDLPAGTHALPRFYMLEFTTYDGAVDPLNWLNQCEQFF